MKAMHGLFKSSQSLSNYMSLGKIKYARTQFLFIILLFFKNLESIGKSISSSIIETIFNA